MNLVERVRGSYDDEVVVEEDEDVNTTDKFGRTALWYASSYVGHAKCVAALLDAKANPDKADDSGDAPLHAASTDNCLENVRILIQHKANVNVLSGEKESPLHHASTCGYLTCVEMLVKAGADVDGNNDNYHTPLACSIVFKRFKVAEFLLHSGAKMKNVHPHLRVPDWIKEIVAKRHTAMYSTLVVKGLLKRRLGLSKDVTNLLGLYFWNLRLNRGSPKNETDA
jgi:ankyrin repeat protein